MSAPLRHKVLLDEDEMPTRWYNILHDLPTPPPPPLHPGTGQPVGPDDLARALPDGPDRPGGHHRAVRRHPRRRCRTSTGCGGPSPLYRAHRLEKALGTPARIYYKYEGVSPAGSHKPNTAVPQAYYNAQGRHPEADHRDRRRPVGHRAGVRVRAVRPRVRGLAGAGLLRRQALPQDHDGDLRRHGAPEPVRPHRGRPRDARQRPRLPRLARHWPSARPSRWRPRTPPPTTRSARCSTTCCCTRRSSARRPCSSWPRSARRADLIVGCTGGGSNFGGLTFPFLREKLAAGIGPGHPRRRAGVLPVADPGHLRLRLRRRRGPDPAAEDAHPGPRLHPRPDPRRRPALPRDEPADQPPLRGGPDRGGRQDPEGLLRGRGAVRPHRGHRAGARADPRPRRGRRRGASRASRPARRRSSSPPCAATGHLDLPAYDAYLRGDLVDHTWDDTELQEAVAEALTRLPAIPG